MVATVGCHETCQGTFDCDCNEADEGSSVSVFAIAEFEENCGEQVLPNFPDLIHKFINSSEIMNIFPIICCIIFLFLINLQKIELQNLSKEDTTEMIAHRLNIKKVPDQIADEIYNKSQGNPFVTEEIVYALRDSGTLQITKKGEFVESPGMLLGTDYSLN